jgi:diguanylate cyclase (GGDEF)-like protein/PAS domain S-box-containing protein
MLHKIPTKVYISLVLVALIGVGLSLTAFFYVKKWELKQAVEIKKRQADEHVRVLRQTFTTFDNVLNSIEGLYHVNNNLTRQEFTKFVRHDLLKRPGIQALLWVPEVAVSQRRMVEQQARQEDVEGFSFWEYGPNEQRRLASHRSLFYPILFAESASDADRLKLLGYDIGTEPVLRAALKKARQTGLLTTSGAIKVATKRGQELGFWVFLPVYQEGSTPVTGQRLVGFVAGIFVFDDLIQTVLRLPKQRTEVFLRLFDESSDATINELYGPAWYHRQKEEQEAVRLWSTSLEFGGRIWLIAFFKSSSHWQPQSGYAWLVLSIGLLFTLALMRYLYIILTHAHWAQELVAIKTQSLSEANQALSKEIEARKEMTIALEASKQRFQAIFHEAAIGIAQTDLTEKIIDSNRSLQLLLRYHEKELYDRPLKAFAHPSDALLDQSLIEKMLSGRYDTYQISKRYICKNGAIVWTNQSCSIVRDTTNPFIINMIEDITERKQAEAARLEAEKKYREIFENAIEGIFQCTPEGHYLSVNPAFVRIFGFQSAEQVYQEITDIGRQIYLKPKRRQDFLELLSTHATVQDFEYQARCRDERIIWVNETVRVIRNKNGEVNYYEGIVEDITERKQTEEKLLYDATHDQLTGLLNRAAFTSYLNKALEELKREHAKLQQQQSTFLQSAANQDISEEKSASSDDSVATTTNADKNFIHFAVLFIDLDRFKIVNDSMGHLVGDILLTETAQRLNNSFNHGDETKDEKVARFGGDEFALMLENLSDAKALRQQIDLIQQQLSQPYLINEETFNTTASIGIALSNPEYNTAEEMLRDADTAMYEAKQQGRGKALIFQPGMHTHIVNMLRMETDLRKALERDEFMLYYQPIISLDTLRTVGLEALIRWQHPQQGMVRPDLFIPLAEETGLIKELGLWVFSTACQQLSRWQNKFPHHTELGMNINVSPIQLKQPQLVQNIQDIIEKAGIKGNTCRVEITEGAMMQDPESALKIFNQLKELEVLLYVDDFGTGYSSLSYLHKFPLDALKIDRSFIKDINDNSQRTTQIAQAIIALGKAFDLKVVAEGVETDFQVGLLKMAHCHQVQGYFFSRPQDSEAIENYLSVTTPVQVSSIH